jgi:acyl carrier protein
LSNSFLSSLSPFLRAPGLAASSLAWGMWAEEQSMAGTLDEASMSRWARMGIDALSTELGLELFDAAQRLDAALLVPVRLDLGALRAQARAGTLPALLRGLVRAPARRAEAAGGSLTQRLAGVPQGDRERFVLDFVRAQAAAVLGHASPEAIDADRAFKKLGFDSLAAVELRNRLTQTTGLRLSTTLIFDHPTPAAIARFFMAEVGGTEAAGRSPLEAELRKIEDLLITVASDEQQLAAFAPRLRSFNNRLRSVLNGTNSHRDDPDEGSDDDLDAVSDEEMFELIDKELGSA